MALRVPDGRGRTRSVPALREHLLGLTALGHPPRRRVRATLEGALRRRGARSGRRGGRVGSTGSASRHRRGTHRRLRRVAVLVEQIRPARHDARRRAGRSRLRGLLPLPTGSPRPGVRPALPSSLRLRPVRRDRKLGLHAVPQDHERLRAAAPAQCRLRRWVGAHRDGLCRCPGRLRDRSPRAARRGHRYDAPARKRTPRAKRGTPRRADHRRPHESSRVPRARRRGAVQQHAGLRDAPLRPPSDPPGAAPRDRRSAPPPAVCDGRRYLLRRLSRSRPESGRDPRGARTRRDALSKDPCEGGA